MSAARNAERRLQQLLDCSPNGFTDGSLIGIEKEALRVTPDGDVAPTPHPAALGSALTHRYITTDFSEALLEFITPTFTDPRAAMQFLGYIHQYTYANIGDELLWTTSMPCKVSGDESIPIARYGSSNVGTMKHVYRRGLSYRYGRLMQAISGVHFNYSLPETLWPAYRELVGDRRSLQDFISHSYFCLVRNFQRYGWLIPYLFGASPAVCKSFLRGRVGEIEGLKDLGGGSWYHPYATALRMSDIGYKNENQSGLYISYDDVDRYVESLTRAIETPYPDYGAIGIVVDGEYRQLNTNILQIENEYYSFVRPKRVAQSGEKPTVALKQRGVEYVEVRALDVSAFDPLGINEDQLRFLESFLVYCLIEDSPSISSDEQREIDQNQHVVATRGRQPGLKLRSHARDVTLEGWAKDTFTAMQGVCELLDGQDTENPYCRSLKRVLETVRDPEALPSARTLAEMRDSGESFFEYAMRMSYQHRAYFQDFPLPDEERKRFAEEAKRSLAEQRDIEASDNISFEQYLERYFRQTAVTREQLSA